MHTSLYLGSKSGSEVNEMEARVYTGICSYMHICNGVCDAKSCLPTLFSFLALPYPFLHIYPPGQDESFLSLPSMNSHVTRELSLTAWILRSIAPWSTRYGHSAVMMIQGTLVLFGGFGECLM